jgi:hypothetical protein
MIECGMGLGLRPLPACLRIQTRDLTVFDTFSRLSPAVVARLGFRTSDVTDVLNRVCREVGYSRLSRSKAFSFEATSV